MAVTYIRDDYRARQLEDLSRAFQIAMGQFANNKSREDEQINLIAAEALRSKDPRKIEAVAGLLEKKFPKRSQGLGLKEAASALRTDMEPGQNAYGKYNQALFSQPPGTPQNIAQRNALMALNPGEVSIARAHAAAQNLPFPEPFDPKKLSPDVYAGQNVQSLTPEGQKAYQLETGQTARPGLAQEKRASEEIEQEFSVEAEDRKEQAAIREEQRKEEAAVREEQRKQKLEREIIEFKNQLEQGELTNKQRTEFQKSIALQIVRDNEKKRAAWNKALMEDFRGDAERAKEFIGMEPPMLLLDEAMEAVEENAQKIVVNRSITETAEEIVEATSQVGSERLSAAVAQSLKAILESDGTPEEKQKALEELREQARRHGYLKD